LPIDSGVVSLLQQQGNDQGVIEKPINLKSGDRIRVKKGILKDLLGIIEKPTSDDERVMVLLNLIHYNMKASIHWTEVEKLGAH